MACALWRMVWAVAQSPIWRSVTVPIDGMGDRVSWRCARRRARRARRRASRPTLRAPPAPRRGGPPPAAARACPPRASRESPATISDHGFSDAPSGERLRAPDVSPETSPANDASTAATCQPICAADQPPSGGRALDRVGRRVGQALDEARVRLAIRRPHAFDSFACDSDMFCLALRVFAAISRRSTTESACRAWCAGRARPRGSSGSS